ncbi:pentatricopeptide repeat-containing protein At2g20710, mitochondrial-like isoform X2 [Rhododendron vialii]|nr:pentatricopeptide repeat-containing protein At2g20710, mitochondrial-like isoform X2 [Rhododendron vialii]XP_058197706.1 pentatricopeptide repeat-containing protein At2g20710, mitochondrial-like isoform X2 [Rhododendron vialii]
MSDKGPVSIADAATRLRLIFRVHGLEQVEKYFNNLPQQLKGFEVYTSLLNCYADENSIEKAESIMQKLGDMGFDRTPFCYNMLLNLYCRIGSREKVDSLMHEMEEKGCCNEHTFTILSSAYAAASDRDGIDGIVEKMESDPKVIMKHRTYAIAADGYLKVGQLDRALEMLKKLEGHISTEKRKNILFPILLTLYTKTGNKDELYRIWNLYKENVKIYNKGYITILSSLLKFNDIEGAEKIFKEWESRGLFYDMRIPNFVIDAYSRNGHMGKAEDLLHNGIRKGGKPFFTTYYCLTGGYILDNQVPKAAEALKKAMVTSSKIRKDTLVTCLEYLEGKGDVDRAEEFISLLRTEGLFSAAVHEKLLNCIKNRT